MMSRGWCSAAGQPGGDGGGPAATGSVRGIHGGWAPPRGIAVVTAVATTMRTTRKMEVVGGWPRILMATGACVTGQPKVWLRQFAEPAYAVELVADAGGRRGTTEEISKREASEWRTPVIEKR